MKEMTRILIPLDGSPTGDTVLKSIHPIFDSGQVEVTLFHVAEPSDQAEEVQRRLELHRRTLEAKGVPAGIRLASGAPAKEILQESAFGEFDLVAMTTHGRTGMDRLLLGSVAEEVVRSSSVPTLLCKSRTRIGAWERIVVALDGTPGSEEVLGDVVRLARSLGSTIHLLQVGLGLLRSDSYRGVSFHTELGDPHAYLEETAQRLMVEGVTAIPERREGIAAVEIPMLACQLDAGLICMTTEGRPELAPGLGRSVAAEVIQTAPCPVFVRRMGGAPGTRGRTRKPARAES